jgi:hypothetical protein
MAKRKRTNNNLQNNTQETKYRATRALLQSGVVLRCFGRVSSYCSTCDTRRVTVKRHEHHLIWKTDLHDKTKILLNVAVKHP